MLRRSPRRTLEALVTQAVALIVALAGFDLKRSVTKPAQSKKHRTAGQPPHLAFTRARGGNFLAREVAVLIKKAAAAKLGHRYESPEFATQVSLVGSSHKSKQ